MGGEILFWNFFRWTNFVLPSLTILIIFGAFSFKNGCLFGEIKSLWIEFGMFWGCFLGQRCHCEESWKWFYKKYKWGKKLLNGGEKTSIVKFHYWGWRIMKSKPWFFFVQYWIYTQRWTVSKVFYPLPWKVFYPLKWSWRILKVWELSWRSTSFVERILVCLDIISKRYSNWHGDRLNIDILKNVFDNFVPFELQKFSAGRILFGRVWNLRFV